LLGHALLDPGLLRAIFSPDRSVVLQAFNLRPDERAAIMASPARTLMELSQELLLALAPRALTDVPEVDVAALCQSIKTASTGAESIASRHVQSAIQRVMTSLPASQYEHAIPAPQADDFVRRKAG